MPRAGGWLDQPLAALAQIVAIDLVVTTYRQKAAGKMEQWSETQAAMIRWLYG